MGRGALMLDVELRARYEPINGESAAAATVFYHEVPAGETHIVQECVAYHDDPAGATLSWKITGPASEGAQAVIVPIGSTAVNIRVRLGAYYTLPMVMPPGWVIYIVAEAPLAAGKKFYIETQV